MMPAAGAGSCSCDLFGDPNDCAIHPKGGTPADALAAGDPTPCEHEARLAEVTHERDEANAGRVPCACGKDTASVKNAQCYACRNAPHWKLAEAESRLRALAEAERAADENMLRLKACEHIAEGEDGWGSLRHECPSTEAVAALRDRYEIAQTEVARLTRERDEALDTLTAYDVILDDALREMGQEVGGVSFEHSPEAHKIARETAMSKLGARLRALAEALEPEVLAPLLLSYECDEPHWDEEKPGYYPTMSWSQLEADRRDEHFGDCTNQPQSCLRCLAEHILHKARWLSAALRAARPEGAGEEGT